jgi:hypothetical protein
VPISDEGSRQVTAFGVLKNDLDNVRNRLKDVLVELKEAHPALAEHLFQSLHVVQRRTIKLPRPPYQYQPSQPMDWEL